MLRESLIADGISKDGKNIFVYNNYAIWIANFSHLYIFIFFNIRNLLHLYINVIFLVFFCGFLLTSFFFCMSWYSCYKFVIKIFNEDLIDEELNPSILNEIIPQTFFSLCNFFLISLLYVGHLLVYLGIQDDAISIPIESLIIFFIFFFSYVLYFLLFKYENCTSMFILGIDGITTLLFYTLKENYLFFPSLLCSAYYLTYHIQKFKKNGFVYKDNEENYMKIHICGYTLIFSALFFKNFDLMNNHLFCFLLLISFVVLMYSDVNLQKMEILHESIENRVMLAYVYSLQLNNYIPGTIN
ncbi:conserved Plasmodium membrane protein, unknown function [Plasmodium malariae]|uniref:Uncharacterized protein n=1 Tax=Plasmodium malariae TaxID=5858 RepID=A0A1D3JIK6_PLAMA|nr:conserved Plasmodium membrane protein, unknown function [Plasmodium malariae]SBT86279.1 conserved Plasmodium membrane protein, unknown function [Plasmodium malariae]